MRSFPTTAPRRTRRNRGHCERSEKLHGQRTRAAKAVAQAVGRPDEFASMSDAELNAEIDRLR